MSDLSKRIRRALSKKDASEFIEIGNMYGFLRVEGISEKKGTSRHIHYNCTCTRCGKTNVIIPSYRLKAGTSKSCGCTKVKHGHCSRAFKGGTDSYRRYIEMHRRCEDPTHRGYERYGARGIKVCERWSGPDGFENFFEDMGVCPPGYQLDRIDGTKGYSPDNCRWASLEIQNRNRKDNIWVEYKGMKLILKDWGDKFGVSGSFISRRIAKGMSMQEIEELAKMHSTLKKGK